MFIQPVAIPTRSDVIRIMNIMVMTSHMSIAINYYIAFPVFIQEIPPSRMANCFYTSDDMRGPNIVSVMNRHPAKTAKPIRSV